MCMWLGVILVPIFPLCSASDGQRHRRMAMPSRAWSSAGKKAGNHPSCRRWNCRHFSACFQRKDKDLAGINTIWISDLVSVSFVNDRVSRARAVGDAADSPQAVAAGYDRCACRKSNTHIQMMESAKKWRRHNATNGMYCSRHRRVLVD